jgi:hypothetical protein
LEAYIKLALVSGFLGEAAPELEILSP